MITLTTGDILKADAQALVNTVNCVGVMGRGLALQFKKCYPENFQEYQRICKDGRLAPGKMLVHDRGIFTNPRFIINFPTKKHWREKSHIDDIRSGLQALVAAVEEHEISSIAIPPLGCGLGGLDWQDIRPLIEAAFTNLSASVEVLIYEPSGAPAAARPWPNSGPPPRLHGRGADR